MESGGHGHSANREASRLAAEDEYKAGMIEQKDQQWPDEQPNLRSRSPICFFSLRIQRYWLSRVGRSMRTDLESTVGTCGNTTTLSAVSQPNYQRSFRFSYMMRELLLTCCDICMTACPICSIFCFSNSSSASLTRRSSASFSLLSPTSSLSRLLSRSYLCLYYRTCSFSCATSICAFSASRSASLTREAIAEQLMRVGSTSGLSLLTYTTLGEGSTKGGSVSTRCTGNPSQCWQGQGQGLLQLQLQLQLQGQGARERSLRCAR